jgi:hypothetical protein
MPLLTQKIFGILLIFEGLANTKNIQESISIFLFLNHLRLYNGKAPSKCQAVAIDLGKSDDWKHGRGQLLKPT